MKVNKTLTSLSLFILNMFNFRKRYLLFTLLLFTIEVLIALFIHDEIIRPYGGDFLVVILLYCLIRSFINTSVVLTSWLALLFAYSMEVLQYFNIVRHLGLSDSKLANIVIGNSFSRNDLLAYTLGILFVLVIEHLFNKEVYQ